MEWEEGRQEEEVGEEWREGETNRDVQGRQRWGGKDKLQKKCNYSMMEKPLTISRLCEESIVGVEHFC